MKKGKSEMRKWPEWEQKILGGVEIPTKERKMKKIDFEVLFFSNEHHTFDKEILDIRDNEENKLGFLNQRRPGDEEHWSFMEKNGKNYWVIAIKNEETGWLPATIVGFVGCVKNDIRIAIHPDHKKKGYARKAVKFISKKFPEASAWIKEKNEASQKLFVKCGFNPTGQAKTFQEKYAYLDDRRLNVGKFEGEMELVLEYKKKQNDLIDFDNSKGPELLTEHGGFFKNGRG